jgi:hypothetical protein
MEGFSLVGLTHKKKPPSLTPPSIAHRRDQMSSDLNQTCPRPGRRPWVHGDELTFETPKQPTTPPNSQAALHLQKKENRSQVFPHPW